MHVLIIRHRLPAIHTASVTFDVHTSTTEMMSVTWCVCQWQTVYATLNCTLTSYANKLTWLHKG